MDFAITLEKAMRILDEHEPYTVGTYDGEGWLFYFDGEKLHNGAKYGMTLDDFINRECVEAYNRNERKWWEKRDETRYIELKGGKAFVVVGKENGTI